MHKRTVLLYFSYDVQLFEFAKVSKNVYLRMLFDEVLGHAHIKAHMTHTADAGRVPHAQLFVGPEGSGTLPMAVAYATYFLCLQHRHDEVQYKSV